MSARRTAALTFALCGLLAFRPDTALGKGPMMLGILGGDLPSEIRISVEDTERFGADGMFVPGYARPARLSSRSYTIRQYLAPGPHLIRRDGRTDPIPVGDWTYYPAWESHPAVVRYEASKSPANEWWRLAPAFERFVNAKIAAALPVDEPTIRGPAPASTPGTDDFPFVPLAAGVAGAGALASAILRRRRRLRSA